MGKELRKLIKGYEEEIPSELNQFDHWIYEDNNNITYLHLTVDVFNGITGEVDSLREELMPIDKKDLEWYVDKIIDFYTFVDRYLGYTQFN